MRLFKKCPLCGHEEGTAQARVTELLAPASNSTPRELAMNTDLAAYDRLRYLFWRYLGWQERLRVLVEVNALPTTATQPIPQTLERVALESVAQDSSKLHDLWEAMMPMVPPDKRAPNPFKPNER